MKNIILFTSICLVCAACYNYDSYQEEFDREVQPTFQLAEGTLPAYANGKDTIEVQVKFHPGSNSDLVLVNFSVDDGVFLENGKNTFSSSELTRVGDDLVIRGTWQTTTTAGEHFVSVEVPKVFKTRRRVIFDKSYPSAIGVSHDKAGVRNGFSDEITLTASLRSELGLPSKGTKVVFEVADTISSLESTLFREVSSTNASGVASAKFTPGNLTVGAVSYRAYTFSEVGDTIFSKSSVFHVLAPE